MFATQTNGTISMDCFTTDRVSETNRRVHLDHDDSFAQAAIDGLLRFLRLKSHVQTRLGIKAAAADGARPSWRIATNSHVGVFELAMDDTKDAGDGIALALRYYPDPEEPVFARFCSAERQLRLSGCFNETGVPAEPLDAGLFQVARFTLRQEDEAWFALRMEAQDVDRRDRQSYAGVRSVERTVPGLGLALAVFDRLVCGFTCLGRRGPGTVRVWRRPGRVTTILADGSVAMESLGYFGDWRVDVMGLRRPWVATESLEPPTPTPAEETPTAIYEGPYPPAFPPAVVNPLWWDAATW